MCPPFYHLLNTNKWSSRGGNLSVAGQGDVNRGRPLTRREFLNLTTRWGLATGVMGIGGIGYIHRVEPYWLDVQFVPLKLPRLAPNFQGYKIVQMSDIHMGDWMTGAHLQELAGIANSHEPDLTVLTGDFFSAITDAIAADMVVALKQLRARDGVLAVLGNHDHWSNADAAREAIKACGISDISNDVHTIERDGSLLHIGGVDDIWERQHRLELVLDKLPSEGAAILLAHEPDFADTSAATERFDLQISGHSHGGQVIVPFLGPLRLPYLGVKYPLGLYRVGSMLQYTNRGVGMIHPYVRFNCRPEITVFTLHASGIV